MKYDLNGYVDGNFFVWTNFENYAKDGSDLVEYIHDEFGFKVSVVRGGLKIEGSGDNDVTSKTIENMLDRYFGLCSAPFKSDEEIGMELDVALYEDDKKRVVDIYMRHYPMDMLLKYPEFMKKKLGKEELEIVDNPTMEDVKNFLLNDVSCSDIAYAGW